MDCAEEFLRPQSPAEPIARRVVSANKIRSGLGPYLRIRVKALNPHHA